jgi:hypothetical protein
MLKSRRFAAVVISLLAGICASLAAAQMLNSERIEQTFGSYGIDVLYSDDTLRLSSLYSLQDGEKQMRTFAAVEYPQVVNEAFAAEHRRILAGGSIGATFRDAGWEVVKINVAFGESGAYTTLAALMGIEPGTKLATHYYRFEVQKNGERHRYASILEMHHPAYLGMAELVSIYAGNDGSDAAPAHADTPAILTATSKLEELGLAVGQ